MSMKTIRSIKQLRAQQKQIQQNIDSLELQMKMQWGSLKESLRPGSIIKEALSSFTTSKGLPEGSGERILKSTITYGAALLLSRLTGRAGEKIRKFFGR